MTCLKKSVLSHPAAWLVVVAASVAAGPALAATTFTTDRLSRQVFCSITVLKGEFHRANQSYAASGPCVELEAVQAGPDGARNRSEFDQYNQSKEIWRANWTAEGSYDPTTKVTTETITLPAPRIDEATPANRPYGRFVSRMVCATDPWLESMANCTAITVTAQGNLGSMEKTLRLMKRPFTSTEKEPMRNGLIEQHARDLRRLDIHPETTTAQAGGAAALNSGRSFGSRNASTGSVAARSGQTGALAARPATGAVPVSTVPASAPAPYGVRSQGLDWGKAAPSALGSR